MEEGSQMGQGDRPGVAPRCVRGRGWVGSLAKPLLWATQPQSKTVGARLEKPRLCLKIFRTPDTRQLDYPRGSGAAAQAVE